MAQWGSADDDDEVQGADGPDQIVEPEHVEMEKSDPASGEASGTLVKVAGGHVDRFEVSAGDDDTAYVIDRDGVPVDPGHLEQVFAAADAHGVHLAEVEK